MAQISVSDLAVELDTDPRNARKFLRAVTPKDAQPGKGSRWAIEKKDLRSLKSKYAKFSAAADQARLDRELAKREANAPEATDGEPTDAELADIDAE